MSRVLGILGAIAALSFALALPVAATAFASRAGIDLPLAAASATPNPGSATLTVTIPGGTGSGGGSGGGGGGTGGGSGTPTKPVVPPNPVPASGRLTIRPHTAHAGEGIEVTGTGFTPGEKVQFVLYPGAVVEGSFIADKHGVVDIPIRLSKTIRTGDHQIEATGWKSAKVEEGTFIVVSGGAAGSSLFPWIVWLIASAALLLAVLGVWLASALGWLPALIPRAAPVAGGQP